MSGGLFSRKLEIGGLGPGVEFGGDGGFEGEGLLGEGVVEGEFPGMEHEARGLDFLF